MKYACRDRPSVFFPPLPKRHGCPKTFDRNNPRMFLVSELPVRDESGRPRWFCLLGSFWQLPCTFLEDLVTAHVCPFRIYIGRRLPLHNTYWRGRRLPGSVTSVGPCRQCRQVGPSAGLLVECVHVWLAPVHWGFQLLLDHSGAFFFNLHARTHAHRHTH